MLDTATATDALKLHANSNSITAQDVTTLLDGVRGTTFAGILYCTAVTPAARNKDRKIVKVTQAQVQLFNNVDAMNVYARAVKRSAGKLEDNDADKVDSFVVQDNYFRHTDCFSIVEHKVSAKPYLYAIYNGADSVYFIDGVQSSKQEVAALLAPAAAAKLLAPNTANHNVGNDILHTVTVRTIALANIVSIAAMRQLVQV